MRHDEVGIGKRVVPMDEAKRRAEQQERLIGQLERRHEQEELRHEQEELRRQLGPTGKEKTR